MAIGIDIGWNPNSPDIDHGFLAGGADRLVDYGGHGARVKRDEKGNAVYGVGH